MKNGSMRDDRKSTSETGPPTRASKGAGSWRFPSKRRTLVNQCAYCTARLSIVQVPKRFRK